MLGGSARQIGAAAQLGDAVLAIGAGRMVSRGSVQPWSPAAAPRSSWSFGTPRTGEGPAEAYNRATHYGRSPTAADRAAIGAGKGEVADHTPPLVQRYYQGDPAIGEKAGWQMTPTERAASAADRTRMSRQPKADSNSQGGNVSAYSRAMKRKHEL
jgi:hypothetical protein